MAALSHSQVDAFSRALLLLNEPVAFDHFAQRAFDVATTLISYDVAGFSSMNRATKAVDAVLSQPAYGFLVKSFEFVDDFYAMPGVADGRYYSAVTTTSMLDFQTVEEFKSRAIYQYFYKEMDVVYDATINYHAEANQTFCQLNLARRRKFSDAERALLGFLQPHLRQRYLHVLAAAPSDHPARPSQLPLAERPWLVCKASGKIREISPTLLPLLADVGFALGSQLPLRWHEWLRSQLRSLDGSWVPAPLEDKNGLRLYCLPNHHSGEHRIYFQRSGATAALTARERDVARWIVQGKNNHEISVILGISRATVKVHVEHILEKLGVENRVAAAALLAFAPA